MASSQAGCPATFPSRIICSRASGEDTPYFLAYAAISRSVTAISADTQLNAASVSSCAGSDPTSLDSSLQIVELTVHPPLMRHSSLPILPPSRPGQPGLSDGDNSHAQVGHPPDRCAADRAPRLEPESAAGGIGGRAAVTRAVVGNPVERRAATRAQGALPGPLRRQRSAGQGASPPWRDRQHYKSGPGLPAVSRAPQTIANTAMFPAAHAQPIAVSRKNAPETSPAPPAAVGRPREGLEVTKESPSIVSKRPLFN